MNAVCVIKHENKTYVVCGGYDCSIYYLSAKGRLLKTIPSSTYSKENPWGRDKKKPPPAKRHVANFIRSIEVEGKERVVVHGTHNSNAARGTLYLFDPLADQPFKSIGIPAGGPVGELRTGDIDDDGQEEFLTGSSSMIQDAALNIINPATGSHSNFSIDQIKKKIDRFGYRVVQPELIKTEDEKNFLSSSAHESCYYPLI